MPESIYIRNITTQALTLVLIEYSPRPDNRKISILRSCLSNVSGIVAVLLGKYGDDGSFEGTTEPSPQPNDTKVVEIRFEPFTSREIEIKRSSQKSLEDILLTFQDDNGGLWNLPFPKTTGSSQSLKPNSPDRSYRCTAFYDTENTVLSLTDTYDLQNWMRVLPSDLPISSLSIPGTHNSATCYRSLPSVRCQFASPRQQLENGIRFFDVRLQPTNKDINNHNLTIVHGIFPISLTGSKKFQNLLEEVYSFLHEHPSETVIMSLKREGTGSATDHHLANILHNHYINSDTDTSKRWFTEPRVPTLKEARGKIILLRRFTLPEQLGSWHSSRGWGLNAERWTYNTQDSVYGQIRVQDFCEVLHPSVIEDKIRICCEYFDRIATTSHINYPGRQTFSTTPPLSLNFLSGSNFWHMGCWPDKIAAKVNPAILSFLCGRHGRHYLWDSVHASDDMRQRGIIGANGGLGIVVCDWVGEKGNWDLVKWIVGINSRLLHHEWNHP